MRISLQGAPIEIIDGASYAFADLPVHHFGSFGKATLHCGAKAYRVRVTDLSDRIAIALPRELSNRANHAVFSGELELNPFVSGLHLRRAVAERVKATGLDLDSLPDHERRQAIMVLNEAREGHVLDARISALLNARSSRS